MNTFQVVFHNENGKPHVSADDIANLSKHRLASLEVTTPDSIISVDKESYEWLKTPINDCENTHPITKESIDKGVQMMNDNKEMVRISVRGGMKAAKGTLTHVPRCLTTFHYERIIWAKNLAGCRQDLPDSILSCVAGDTAMHSEVSSIFKPII